jgi:hypothetical protein
VSRGGAAVVVHGSSEATSSPEVEEQDSRRGSWEPGGTASQSAALRQGRAGVAARRVLVS